MEPNTVDTLENTTDTAPEATEVLVEEISIDGMCGVY
jgi:mycofactocin precursor